MLETPAQSRKGIGASCDPHQIIEGAVGPFKVFRQQTQRAVSGLIAAEGPSAHEMLPERRHVNSVLDPVLIPERVAHGPAKNDFRKRSGELVARLVALGWLKVTALERRDDGWCPTDGLRRPFAARRAAGAGARIPGHHAGLLNVDDRKLADKLRTALGEKDEASEVERLVRRILAERQQAVTA